MSWVKLDDGFWQNRKIRGLTHAAHRLYTSALSYAGYHLTDGYLDNLALVDLFAVTGAKPKQAAELVNAGLWDLTGQGYVIHDYLDLNPTREKVLEDRERNRERKERWRAGNAVRNTSRNVGTDTGTDRGKNDGPTRPVKSSKGSRDVGPPGSGDSRDWDALKLRTIP